MTDELALPSYVRPEGVHPPMFSSSTGRLRFARPSRS